MGYSFLSIAVFLGAVKGFLGKKMSAYVEAADDAMHICGLRLILCAVFGFVILVPELLQKGFALFGVSADILFVSFISGIANAGIIVLWLLIVQKGALALIEVFSLIGTVIPLGLSCILYNEKIYFNQYLGLIMLLSAVLLMYSYNIKIKNGMSCKQIIMLILFAVSNGTADFTQKAFSNLSAGRYLPAVFNLYTYFFAFIAVLIFLIVKKFKTKAEPRSLHSAVNGKVFLYVLFMAICLYLNSFFKTLSADYLSAVKIYPLVQGASLVLNCLMGAVFFGERITVKNATSVIISFLALI